MYNQQGITNNYPQYTTNFWGDAGNNYGFGSSNISSAISTHPAMNTTPTPLQTVQSNQALAKSTFADTFGGYAAPDGSISGYQTTPKQNTVNTIPAPRTSAGGILLEGVKGFGKGVFGGLERFTNSLTGGVYGNIVDGDINNAYTNRQNYLQNLANQAGLGKLYERDKNFLDVDAALMNYYLLRR